MKNILFIVLAVVLLAGCAGLPTLSVTPTPKPTQGNARATLTPKPANATESVGSVRITGDVYIRDGQDVRRGTLRAGSEVLAVCEGDWCVLAGSGLRFWRGCSSDNPEGLKCLPR
ncbi:MAG TPA: hypothetical protein VIY48_06965 [Candidatus Paceibacterota bacterium]